MSILIFACPGLLRRSVLERELHPGNFVADRIRENSLLASDDNDGKITEMVANFIDPSGKRFFTST